MKKISKFINDCINLIKAYTYPVDELELKRRALVDEWHRVRGDITLRLNYNLNKDSVIFDVGGYVGQWASDIYSKFGCTIYVFEPVSEYYNFIVNRFKQNPKIIVINAGLGARTTTQNINVFNENSSVFDSLNVKDATTERIKIIDICEFMKASKIKKIDLIKVNIEGGEYKLLSRLINSKMINNIHNIQVQYHSFVSNADNMREQINRKLSKTHLREYDYPFVWESWKRK